MALWDLENERCVRCGQLVAEHGDPDKLWFPQRIVDYAEMQLAGAQALYAGVHEERPYHDGTFTDWSKERTSRHPFRYDDGVSIILAAEDLFADDDFLTNERAAPSRADGVDRGHSGPETAAQSQ